MGGNTYGTLAACGDDYVCGIKDLPLRPACLWAVSFMLCTCPGAQFVVYTPGNMQQREVSVNRRIRCTKLTTFEWGETPIVIRLVEPLRNSRGQWW